MKNNSKIYILHIHFENLSKLRTRVLVKIYLRSYIGYQRKKNKGCRRVRLGSRRTWQKHPGIFNAGASRYLVPILSEAEGEREREREPRVPTLQILPFGIAAKIMDSR